MRRKAHIYCNDYNSSRCKVCDEQWHKHPNRKHHHTKVCIIFDLKEHLIHYELELICSHVNIPAIYLNILVLSKMKTIWDAAWMTMRSQIHHHWSSNFNKLPLLQLWQKDSTLLPLNLFRRKSLMQPWLVRTHW